MPYTAYSLQANPTGSGLTAWLISRDFGLADKEVHHYQTLWLKRSRPPYKGIETHFYRGRVSGLGSEPFFSLEMAWMWPNGESSLTP